MFPNDAPHCVYSLPSTIDMSIHIEGTLSLDCWLSETQVSQHPVVRNNPTPVPVSPDHFGVSLRENLKVGLSEEQPALLACWSISACRGS